jgi:hypothetical protein
MSIVAWWAGMSRKLVGGEDARFVGWTVLASVSGLGPCSESGILPRRWVSKWLFLEAGEGKIETERRLDVGSSHATGRD